MNELTNPMREYLMAMVAPEEFSDGGAAFERALDAALALHEAEGGLGECGCDTCWRRMHAAADEVRAVLGDFLPEALR